MSDTSPSEPRLATAGVAMAAEFGDDAEVLATLFAVVRDRLDRARGDSTHEAVRRESSLNRRLKSTSREGPLLARALKNWELGADEIVVFGVALAAAIDFEIAAELPTVCGGPVLNIGGAARLISASPEPSATRAAVLAVERMLSPTGRLGGFDLVRATPAEVSLLSRSLLATPRALAIARGEERCPPIEIVAATVSGAGQFASIDIDRLRAFANRARGEGVLGWLIGGDGAELEQALCNALAVDGWKTLRTTSSSLLRDVSTAEVSRESRIHEAVVAVCHDIDSLGLLDARELARAIDGLANATPTFFVNNGVAEPRLPTRSPRLTVVAAPPSRSSLRDALRAHASGQLVSEQIEALADSLVVGPALVRGLGKVLSLIETPSAKAVEVAGSVIGSQRGLPVRGPLRSISSRRDKAKLSNAFAAQLEDAASRWRALEHKRLTLYVEAEEAITIAIGFATELGLGAVTLDLPRLQALPADAIGRTLSRAFEAARANNAVILDVGAPGRWREGHSFGFSDLWGRLHDQVGLFIACSRHDAGASWRGVASLAIVEAPTTTQGLWSKV